jgi:hypothetical protein
MFCPRCGAETDGSARYCAECGASLPRAGEPGEPKRSIRARLAALVGRTRRERIITVSTAAVVAVAVAAFFALDTGGDDDGGASGRVAVADIRAADAACVEAKRTIRRSAAQALRSDGGSLEAYSGDFLRAVVEFRVEIRSLGGGPDIDRLDRALREVAIEAGALSRVTREKPRAAGSRAATLDAATAEVEAAIAELGLDGCAAVELDPRSLLVVR